MLQVKNFSLNKEYEDYIIDLVEKSKDFSLLLNTDVYSSCTEDYLEIFKEYPIYIEDLDITLTNISKINITDNDLEFYSEDVLICTISLLDKFYSITFEENDEDKKYVLTHSDRNVDLPCSYPIVNSSIENDKMLFIGRIYLKFSPLEFNTKNIVYEYKDSDYDMVSLKLLEQKKNIDNNISKFSQLFTLTGNNIIIYRRNEDDNINIGKCIKKDDTVLKVRYIYENNSKYEIKSDVFYIKYKDIYDANLFLILQEHMQLVKLDNDKAHLLSNPNTEYEEDINNNIDLIKKYNSMIAKINRLYNNIYFSNTSIEIENREECIEKLQELDEYMIKLRSLKVFELDPSGFIVLDVDDYLYPINNITDHLIKLDNIREILYKEE